MTFFCFRTMLSPLTMLISQDCTWKHSTVISQNLTYIIYIICNYEIYHIYHRSVVQLFILVLQPLSTKLIFIHHRLQMPTIWQDGVQSIYMLYWLNKVNAETPSLLLDNHGFPMSFLAGTPTMLKTNFFWWSTTKIWFLYLLLVTTIKNINLPAQESVSVALVVDCVWGVSVRGPLEDSRLAFLTV